MSLFEIALHPCFDFAGGSVKCCAWIDPAYTSIFDSQIQVHLHRTERGWRGAFLLPSPQPAFYYRLGIVGTVGTWWRWQIRSASSGAALVHDADCLLEPKTWIFGSWGLHEVGVSAPDARTMHASAHGRTGRRAAQASAVTRLRRAKCTSGPQLESV